MCNASPSSMHEVGPPKIIEDMGSKVVSQTTQCTACNAKQQEIYEIGDFQYVLAEKVK